MADPSQVTQVIDALPESPKEGSGYRVRVTAFFAGLIKFALQLEIFRGQVNTVATEVSDHATVVATNLTTVTGAATAATGAADTATAAAATSTTKADEAAESATAAGTARTGAEAARDVAGGYAAEAGAYAAGLNMPPIYASDAGKTLVVNASGVFEVGDVSDVPEVVASNAGDLLRVSAAGTWEAVKALTVLAATPAHYARDILGGVAGYTDAADRRTYLTPNRVTCNINDSGYYLAGQQRLDLNLAATWDSTAPDYTVPANRAGKDFYRYAVNDNGTIRIVCSANSTYPTGYTASNSRKLGGFHCVCLSYGAISGHTLTGFITGDIIPGSVWDLMHLPNCVGPEGMVWDAGIRLWADIYGNSYNAGKLVPVYNATLVDGVSSPAFHFLKAAQYLSAVGKRPFWQHEFLYLALGCNEGTNISTSADPNVAGAFTDTAGRRMVSNNGCEMMAGGMWWWALDTASAGTAAWKNAFDGNDSGVGGQMYMEPNRALVGGNWNSAALCGSRALSAANGPLPLNANCGVRGVAETGAV